MRKRQRRHELGDFGCDRLQVRCLRGVDGDRIQFGDIEQLADDMSHTLDIVTKRLADFGILEHIDPRPQDA